MKLKYDIFGILWMRFDKVILRLQAYKFISYSYFILLLLLITTSISILK